MVTFLIILYVMVGLGFGAKYFEDGENKYLSFFVSFLWPVALGYTIADRAG